MLRQGRTGRNGHAARVGRVNRKDDTVAGSVRHHDGSFGSNVRHVCFWEVPDMSNRFAHQAIHGVRRRIGRGWASGLPCRPRRRPSSRV